MKYFFYLLQFVGKNLLTFVGSQGGELSIVTVGPDTRVKGLIAFYSALSYIAGYVHGYAGGWSYMFEKEGNQTIEKESTTRYYDAVDFARQLKVPEFFEFGYNDMVYPPITTYPACNVIQAPKQLLVSENTAHYAYHEQWTMNFFNEINKNYRL